MKRVAVVLVLLLAGIGAGSRAPTVVRAAGTIIACPLSATAGTGTCPFGATLGLQNAIGAATPGTTIHAVSGCYYENLFLAGIPSSGITIMGSGPGAHTPATSPAALEPTDPCFSGLTTTQGTYIDGMCDGFPTVEIDTSTVTIEGVTIQNGCVGQSFGSPPQYQELAAGGLQVDSFSSVQLSNSWVFFNANSNTGNRETTFGDAGGILSNCENSVQLMGDVVENNENQGFGPGGINNFESYGLNVVPFSGFSCSFPAVGGGGEARPAPASAGHPVNHAPWGGMPHAAAQPAGHAPGTHPHRDAIRGAAPAAGLATATPSGSQLTGVRMLLQKTTVTVNLAFNGPAGMNNAGTAQINGSRITNNFGGGIGGLMGGEFNGNTGVITQVNGSGVQNNQAGYFGAPGGCGSGCNVGGIGSENQMFLSNVQVTGNTYNVGLGLPAVAGGLYDDPDALPGRNDPLEERLFHLTLTTVTNNTPPQCGSSSGPAPC